MAAGMAAAGGIIKAWRRRNVISIEEKIISGVSISGSR